jgi:micrococcal nuclease
VLTNEKQEVKIRLAEIDAPERHQPYGEHAKQSLSDLCFGKQVEVQPRVKDQYKRTVAHIKCAGVDANTEQVRRGMAWVYRRYARDHNLYVIQHDAKSAKRGAELVETVLSRQLDDLEQALMRHGYRLKDMVEQFDAKPAEIRALFSNRLDPARTAELRDRILAAGLPI